MEKIEIDGKMFGYHIYPRFGKVYAEIYYTKKDSIEIQVISKSFGSIWRDPIESDYTKAVSWCKEQLNYIQRANA